MMKFIFNENYIFLERNLFSTLYANKYVYIYFEKYQYGLYIIFLICRHIYVTQMYIYIYILV